MSAAKGRTTPLEHTMHRTARRTAFFAMSGFQTMRPPRGGWHREDPSTGEDGGVPGHNNGGGGDGKNGDSGDGKEGKDAGSGKDPNIDGDFDADRARRSIAAARESEKKAKADKKAADDRLTAVLKAAGLTPDGKTDPEEQAKALTTRAEQAEARATALATKNAIRDGAEKHKANAAELLDSQKFLTSLKDLDPAANDFDDKVADLVKATVKNNPAKYGAQTGQATNRRGADHTGGGTSQGRSQDLTSAVAKKLGG
jgi:hypothetical protein